MKRISIRMFFVKFLEYRGAKRLGLETWREAKIITEKIYQVEKTRATNLIKESFEGLKLYTLYLCKVKREKAFQAFIFSEKWLKIHTLNLLK